MALATRHGAWILLVACTSVRPAPDASATVDRPDVAAHARDADAGAPSDVADGAHPDAGPDSPTTDDADAPAPMDVLDPTPPDDRPDASESVDAVATDVAVDDGAELDADARMDAELVDIPCEPWIADASAWSARDAVARDAACDTPPFDSGIRREALPDGGLCPAWNPYCVSDLMWCSPFVQTSDWVCGGCLRHCFDDPFSTARCNEVVGRCEHACRDRAMDCDCDPTTACDTNVVSDRLNCGACGHACAPGETCVGGRCRVPGTRPLAPISALRVGARPWFRWRLPGCADGARVEVCASRSCASIEHTWDVRGERYRPTAALRDGVHFWRVTARRGDAPVGTTSDVWEFAVGPAPTGAPSRYALLDADGDGVEEAPSSIVFNGNRSWMQRYHNDPHGVSYGSSGPVALGDIDGDGFGDVGFLEYSLDHHPRGPVSTLVWLYVRLGSARGLRTVPLALPLTRVFSNVIETPKPVGDRNGDGYGDLWWQSGSSICPLYCEVGSVMGGNVTIRRVDEPESVERWNASGDFDGDGLADLVFTARFTAGSPRTYTLAPGVPDGVAPRRRAFECRSVPAPEIWMHDDTHWVADYNDDGYDDLIASEGPGTPLLVFFGGPDGLVETRCARVAR